MTPAINHLKRAKIKFHIHEYEHNPECNTYGKEAAKQISKEYCFRKYQKTLFS
jgi:Cys-tRNA(Pro)/Cys-tRNA(Cys) deacylase